LAASRDRAEDDAGARHRAVVRRLRLDDERKSQRGARRRGLSASTDHYQVRYRRNDRDRGGPGDDSSTRNADDAAEQSPIVSGGNGLDDHICSIESNLAEQRQADLNQINQQLGSLSQKQQEMAAQLPQAHLLDLISQLVSLNQLPKALQKLSHNVQKLAQPKTKSIKKAKAKKTKTTKSKRKKSS